MRDPTRNEPAVFPVSMERVLTEAEAIEFLRLNETGVQDPARTLRYYREKGRLRATQIGRHVRYLLSELVLFVRRQTEENPR